MRPWALIAAGVLAPGWASAGGFLQVGPAVAGGGGVGPYYGTNVQLGVDVSFARWHALGVAARVGDFETNGVPAPGSMAPAVAMTLRYRVHAPADFGSVRPYGVLNAGAGLWTGCVRGDACGGFGPVVGVELGVEYAVFPALGMTAGIDAMAQTGMGNGVDVLWVGTLFVGVKWGAGRMD